MNQFFLLYDEWELADETAGRMESCVSEQLERYCDGVGPAPAASDIAGLKVARQLALQRLRALRAYIAAQRMAALVI
jgi:cytochrome c553